MRFLDRLVRRDHRPLLLGIVNVTPDSFSDGGRYFDAPAAIRHGLQLVQDGADALDVGGESSRPGAEPVPLEEELRRVSSVLEGLAGAGVPLSIDTTKAEVARRALDLGVEIVNDISGLRFDPRMLPLVAGCDCAVVLMHMQGEPRGMQAAPYYDDVVPEIRAWFESQLDALDHGGVGRGRVVLDPGLGFGKRFEDNLALLRSLDRLRAGDRPLLVGASRKSFVGRLLDEPDATRRLEGDLAVAAHCAAAGVEMLRVHDVRAARRFLDVLGSLGAQPVLDREAPRRQ